MSRLRSLMLASFALTFGCTSNDAAHDGADASARDADRGDASAGEPNDASEASAQDAAAQDAAEGCGPQLVLGADPSQITVLDAAPLWTAASIDETLVGYASNDAVVVLGDELPGNPARWAIVVAPFDRTTPRRLAVEAVAPIEMRIFGRDAYWLSSGANGLALRAIALDAMAPAAPRTVTTLPPTAVQGAYFVDGDAVHWLERRHVAGDASLADDAVLVHAALANGTPEDGPTLGPYPPSSGTAAPSPTPYFSGLTVKSGYVYSALITSTGGPSVTPAFTIEREPADGGVAASVAQGSGAIPQIFTTDHFVYWVVDSSTHDADGVALRTDYAITQAALDGSGAKVVARHDPINAMTTVPFVHVEGGVLYWFDGPDKTAEFLRAFCE